jgi:hypothetical protein
VKSTQPSRMRSAGTKNLRWWILESLIDGTRPMED